MQNREKAASRQEKPAGKKSGKRGNFPQSFSWNKFPLLELWNLDCENVERNVEKPRGPANGKTGRLTAFSPAMHRLSTSFAHPRRGARGAQGRDRCAAGVPARCAGQRGAPTGRPAPAGQGGPASPGGEPQAGRPVYGEKQPAPPARRKAGLARALPPAGKGSGCLPRGKEAVRRPPRQSAYRHAPFCCGGRGTPAACLPRSAARPLCRGEAQSLTFLMMSSTVALKYWLRSISSVTSLSE